MNKIPEAVMRRLPRYYRHLSSLENNGIIRVSSKQLGESLLMTASQIRHDLNFFGGFGQQGYGYNVSELKAKLVHILGIDVKRKIVIVGAGNIGTALARHEEFEKEGYSLLALFDNGPKVIGTEINGKKVYDIDSLPDYIVKKRNRYSSFDCACKVCAADSICKPEGGSQSYLELCPGGCRAERYTGGKYTSDRFAYDAFIQACKYIMN